MGRSCGTRTRTNQQVRGVAGPAPPAPARRPRRASLGRIPAAGALWADLMAAERGGGPEATVAGRRVWDAALAGSPWRGQGGMLRARRRTGRERSSGLVAPAYEMEPKRAPSHRGRRAGSREGRALTAAAQIYKPSLDPALSSSQEAI